MRAARRFGGHTTSRRCVCILIRTPVTRLVFSPHFASNFQFWVFAVFQFFCGALILGLVDGGLAIGLLQNAKAKFQQLQNVMAILGDPEKRELYDQTGSIAAADIDVDAVQSLSKFLRTLFKQVTVSEFCFLSCI